MSAARELTALFTRLRAVAVALGFAPSDLLFDRAGVPEGVGDGSFRVMLDSARIGRMGGAVGWRPSISLGIHYALGQTPALDLDTRIAVDVDRTSRALFALEEQVGEITIDMIASEDGASLVLFFRSEYDFSAST